MSKITHLMSDGHTHMVDVSDKSVTKRIAVAEGTVYFPPEVYAQIQASQGQTAKGTITEIARIAGIMAAKNTAGIIPLCHPMMLERCKLFWNIKTIKAACTFVPKWALHTKPAWKWKR